MVRYITPSRRPTGERSGRAVRAHVAFDPDVFAKIEALAKARNTTFAAEVRYLVWMGLTVHKYMGTRPKEARQKALREIQT